MKDAIDVAKASANSNLVQSVSEKLTKLMESFKCGIRLACLILGIFVASMKIL